MATGVKISALPAAGPLTGAEIVPVVQGGVTRRTTASQLAGALSGDLAVNDIDASGHITAGNYLSVTRPNIPSPGDGISVASQSALRSSSFSNGTAAGPINFNTVTVEDQAKAGPLNLVHALLVNHNFGGGSATGGFSGLSVVLNQVGPTANVLPVGGSFYVALNLAARFDENDGGTGLTSATAFGHAFASNPSVWLDTGATFWNQIVGEEINVAMKTGSSAVDKIGLQVVKVSGDAVKAARSNTAFVIGDQPSTVGWDKGISFGSQQGRWPMDAATGVLISDDVHEGDAVAGTCLAGIDLSRCTFTSAPLVMPFKTPASAAATGKAGSICWDANFVYICTAANTWKRAAIATW